MTLNAIHLRSETSYQERTMAEKREYVTVAEAAGILGIHPETVGRMIREGRIPAELVIEKGRAKYRILRSDLDNVNVNPQGRPPKSQTEL